MSVTHAVYVILSAYTSLRSLLLMLLEARLVGT